MIIIFKFYVRYHMPFGSDANFTQFKLRLPKIAFIHHDDWSLQQLKCLLTGPVYNVTVNPCIVYVWCFCFCILFGSVLLCFLQNKYTSRSKVSVKHELRHTWINIIRSTCLHQTSITMITRALKHIWALKHSHVE